MDTRPAPRPAPHYAAQPTQRPWEIGDDPCIVYKAGDPEDEPAIAVTWDEDSDAFAWLGDRSEAEANARFIVRACNSHDSLLFVARYVITYYESCLEGKEGTGGLGADEQNILNEARAAVAKAEKERA